MNLPFLRLSQLCPCYPPVWVSSVPVALHPSAPFVPLEFESRVSFKKMSDQIKKLIVW